MKDGAEIPEESLYLTATRAVARGSQASGRGSGYAAAARSAARSHSAWR